MTGGWVLAKATFRYRKASADSEATLLLAEGLAGAKTDKQVEAAIESLVVATQTTIDDLRERVGATYSTASHAENRNEFQEVYAVAKERADAANPEERGTPTGWRGIEEWSSPPSREALAARQHLDIAPSGLDRRVAS
jgi:hypothetical protein